MKISGLAKLTLLDYPEHVACTVFLAGCNFRCPFCHNRSLVCGGENEISVDDFFAFLKKRQGLIDGVCITGGEPLLNDDILPFVSKIKDIGYLVKLDTNGSRPERLAELIENKLVDYVAMDIKNSIGGYEAACGVRTDMSDIERSVEVLKKSGIEHEFRTTVVGGIHSITDIAECAKWIGHGEKYYLQGYKNSGDIIAPEGLSELSADELRRFLEEARKFAPLTELRGTE